MPYVIQRGLVYSSFTAISGLANVYGLEAGSAAGIVAKINTFATIPFSAFNIGVATICAQCCGKRDIRRATGTMFTGLLLCLASGGTMFALCQLFPKAVLSIFTSNADLIEIGVPFLRGYSWEYIIMPFTWSIHGLFSGCGHTVIPAFDGILASVVFRTPLALFFSRTVGMGYGGISFGASMAVFSAVIAAWAVFFSGIWKRKSLFDKHSGLIGEG
jgi:Na+-driven multidrug efflux pump